MFIHVFCLCPLGLATELNFNISKEAYYTTFHNIKSSEKSKGGGGGGEAEKSGPRVGRKKEGREGAF